MNRRRVGLGVVAAGAAVAARRKLRRQLDAGTTVDVDLEATDVASVNGPSHPVDAPAVTPSGAVDPVSTPEPTASGSEATEPQATEPQASEPPSSEPLSSDVLIERVGSGASSTATPSLSSASLLDDTKATLGSPELGDPEISSEAIATEGHAEPAAHVESAAAKDDEPEPAPTAPPIVLPTMAAAGTIVVPKADGSAATLSPAQPVPDVSLPTAPVVTKPPPLSAAPPTPPGAASSGSTDEIGSTPPPSPFSLSDADVASAKSDQSPMWRRRVGGWSILSLALLVLLGVGAFAASVYRLPYYRLQPGSVYDTIERVEAPGDLVFVPDGEIGFVTVSQTANITPWQWLDAQLDENVRIRHEDEVRGEQTADEARANDLRRMQVSKNSAVVVALEKLGYELIITPIGVEVAQVFDCTAADGSLGTGDLIVAVNGNPTPDGERLVEQLINAGIGEEVELLVERIDPSNPTQSMRTDLVGLTLGSADDPCLDESVRADEPRPFIGIGTQTIFDEDLPIDIDVRTGRVGGPSAGLAFTLAIMDVLSDGELTNGLKIVATGSIDRDGRVGPVGGIHQKTVAAERAGADIFLVPACCDNFVDRTSGEPLELPSNFEEAQEHADEMLVVGVENIDDALRAIAELGGDVEDFLEP